jgi:hypothetical protein
MVALSEARERSGCVREETLPGALLKVLRDEGQARAYVLSHIASGPTRRDKFESRCSERGHDRAGARDDPRG